MERENWSVFQWCTFHHKHWTKVQWITKATINYLSNSHIVSSLVIEPIVWLTCSKHGKNINNSYKVLQLKVENEVTVKIYINITIHNKYSSRIRMRKQQPKYLGGSASMRNWAIKGQEPLLAQPKLRKAKNLLLRAASPVGGNHACLISYVTMATQEEILLFFRSLEPSWEVVMCSWHAEWTLQSGFELSSAC